MFKNSEESLRVAVEKRGLIIYASDLSSALRHHSVIFFDAQGNQLSTGDVLAVPQSSSESHFESVLCKLLKQHVNLDAFPETIRYAFGRYHNRKASRIVCSLLFILLSVIDAFAYETKEYTDGNGIVWSYREESNGVILEKTPIQMDRMI